MTSKLPVPCPKYLRIKPTKVPTRWNFIARDALLTTQLGLKGFRGQKKALHFKGLSLGEMTDQAMKDSSNKPGGAGKQGGLNAEIQSRIGHQLRAMYDDVVRQGVPDRFAELIRQLDSPEAAAQVAAGSLDATVKKDGRD